MPPVQEVMEIISMKNRTPSSFTRSPAFPKCESNVFDENDIDSSKIPSTAEQCKEIIDRSKRSSPNFGNNNNSNVRNFNNLMNNVKDDDDEDDCWNLTSLEWLQDRNLLKKVITNPDSGRSEGFLSGSPTPSDDGRSAKCNPSCKFILPKIENPADRDGFEPLMPSAYHPTRHADCKPPYSFSCLIFMAIENSPEKRLPVKDIYAWIQNNFPFFSRAPSGWKNSVRHNLSLNKCFTKVEKDRGAGIGKGSYWCVDPTYKANLLHALRKTPYQPFHQMQMVSSNHVAASFGTPVSSSLDTTNSSNIKSLFPYTSRKARGKLYADSSEIDVANALVSLKKSNVDSSKSVVFGRDDEEDDEDECDDDDEEWVDEDVDEEEEDYDDEETAMAEMIHVLKRKLGQQKVQKDFCCTPSASTDHQYGMNEDRVRDILTRFDCFDECCSVSTLSDEDDAGGDSALGSAGSTDVSLPADVEIKQEIKEEPLSADEEGIAGAVPVIGGGKHNRGSKVKGKKTKSTFKRTGFSVALVKANPKITSAARASAKANGRKRSSATNKADGGPPSKRRAGEFDEEEQRVREGADALLELATIAASGRCSASSDDSSGKRNSNQDLEVKTFESNRAAKKSGKRGRPPATKKQKSLPTSNANDDDADLEFYSSRRSDSKRRLPKDFVPNGLISVSSAPRSFQSKRLQMRYFEQIISNHEASIPEPTKSSKPIRSSTHNKTYTPRARQQSVGMATNSNVGIDPTADDFEEIDSKDWLANFSSIDLSEVNTTEFGRVEVVCNPDGTEMLVKEEPLEDVRIKEEVDDFVVGYAC